MKKALILVFIFLNSLCIYAQNTTINITSYGSGDTFEKAKQNALINAINDTYGYFVSNNTKISNDSISYDNVDILSKGVVKSFKIIDEIQLPNLTFNVTLNVDISLKGAEEYFKKDGDSFVFDGNSFLFNIKQQDLNKKNELKIIKNICENLKFSSINSFDYKLKINKGLVANNNNEEDFSTIYEVDVFANENFAAISERLVKVLKNICLSKSDIISYEKNKTSMSSVAIKTNNENSYLFFRNSESIDILKRFCISLAKIAINFKIDNGSNIFDISTFKSNNPKNRFQFFDRFPLMLINHDEYPTIYSSFFYNSFSKKNADPQSPNLNPELPSNSSNYFQFSKNNLKVPFTYIINDNFFNHGVDLVIGFNLISEKKSLINIIFYETITLENIKNVKKYEIIK
jgi:hypothetical protein